MNTRFYNAKILVLDAENHFSIAEGELHVTGDTITYIGPDRKVDPDAAETPVFDREIDARGALPEIAFLRDKPDFADIK